jgi:chemotaxis signal transduction protein
VTGTDPRHQHPAPESRPRSQATVLKERVELALDALESHSREFELGLLDKRARDIARPTKTDVAADSLIDVVAFAIGAGIYAIPTSHTLHIVRITSLAPIPGQTGTLRGVCVYAGEIVPVFDIAALLGEPEENRPVPDWGLMIGTDEVEAAILVDRIQSVKSIRSTQLERLSRAALQNDAGRFIVGTLANGLTLIDADRLLEHECMNVAL